MNELVNIDVKIIPASISFDLAPVNELVNTLKTAYTGWVVKEEDLKSASDTIAQINKVSKAISDKRIAIGKEFKKPYDDFEKTVKGICTELDNLAKSIKDQTDIYEEKRKCDKKAIIHSLPGFNPYIIFDEKWLNKGTSIELIANAISDQNFRRKTEEDTIAQACGNLRPDRFLDMLHNGMELPNILSSINAAIELASRPIPTTPQIIPTPQPAPQPTVEPKREPKKTLSAQFIGTETMFDKIEAFCRENEIKIDYWEVN